MKRSNIVGIATSFLVLFFSCSLTAQQFRVVGYLYNWGNNFAGDAGNVDYTKVTHINIAFLNPDSTGNLSPTNSLSTVVNTIHNNKAKVLASLGGAGSPPIWATLMAPDQRDTFISKIISFINTYNLDGIDIDLEGAAIDYDYNYFIPALKAALPSGKLLTAAVSSSIGYAIYDETLAVFDYINVMSYDYCGSWNNTACQHSPYAYAVSDVNYFKSRGLAKENVVLGLPSYGYRWETNHNSQPNYMQIVNAFPRAANQDSIHTLTNGLIYHNSIPTIKEKTTFAFENAGGVMWWALQFDYPTTDSRSLLRAMSEMIPNSVEAIKGQQEIQMYPNPLSSIVTINFSNTQSGMMSIYVFDLNGKKVSELYNGNLSAGNFSQSFNVDFLAPGIYTCIITTNEKVSVLKMVKE